MHLLKSTFVLASRMCKNQTSVSHSSTESEVISLDAGLRIDGIPGLDLWDLVMGVLHSSNNVQHGETLREMRFEANTPTPTPKRRDTITANMMSCLMWTTLSHIIKL